MVEAYLAAISEPPSSGARLAPILLLVRGILKNADIDEHRKHLTRNIDLVDRQPIRAK
jgi:hypothetical protein